MKYILLDLQAKDEGTAIIKINRPEVLNALNKETMSELSVAQEEKQQQHEEKQRINQLAKILNKKLIDECLSIAIAKEIAKNSFNATKTSKMLINKGMDADVNTGLQLEVYGWALCFAHETEIQKK
jgi:enoyl-CoA hydratase/carnithine racemase